MTAALLAYVLPAASPGTLAMVLDRLAGWWMASLAGTAAVLLLSPRLGENALRRDVAKLAAIGPEHAANGSYYGIWLCEHLSHLGEHLGELTQPAAQVAEIRRRPWWR